MSAIIGIDLGTTYSAIARLDESGKPEIIPVDGERIMASCVYAPKDEPGLFLVGGEARNALGVEPKSVLKRFKRDMGTDRVYKLRQGLSLTPAEASAQVLRKLIQEASKVVGAIEEVVITVPANFNERQRRATIEAGEEAGVNVKNIINEPTAAMLAVPTDMPVNGRILIYDLGGGTFDVTIAEVAGREVEVLTSEGDASLGGMDFDKMIADLCDQHHKTKYGRFLRSALGIINGEGEDDSLEWQELLLEAEEAKRLLSKREKAGFLYRAGPDGPLDIQLKRAEIEQKVSAMIGKTEMLVETALDNIDAAASDIDHVLLVGGSTRIPAIKASLKRLFRKEPLECVNPDEAVALGAAVYAGLRSDRSKMNPVQRRKIEEISVVDVATHYYGTVAVNYDEERQIAESQVSVILEKDKPLPCRNTERYRTMHDGQRIIRCVVTQSKQHETNPKYVTILHEAELKLPAGRPAGQPIDVTFIHTVDDILEVEFLDVTSGIKHGKNLSPPKKKVSKIDIDEFKIE